MFLKCILLFFVLADISAYTSSDGLSDPRLCPYPRFNHGKFRMRLRSKIVKFTCNYGFMLIGNKYASCRDGEWDVPIPVCAKSGCPIPTIEKGVPMTSNGGAWLVFFCFPDHELVGSPALYCDGRRWNGTAPVCTPSTAPAQLSCDFEDPKLCGWTQDEKHDFDWDRLNKKTPSAFVFTGPSFDHTLGENGTGYYMYIESTSREENETARLVSPIYRASLTRNGCFNFFYHMFGSTIGGLRVYQKPETMSIKTLLESSNTSDYLLFEKWGRQGDFWYTGISSLYNSSEDFQIVIEGVRGSSFTSDIAIDDVSILQGDNCTIAKNTATTPAIIIPDSCSGRCDVMDTRNLPNAHLFNCGCGSACVYNYSCCPDFFDLCVFGAATESTGDDDSSDLPQTQKLVSATNASESTTTTTLTRETTIPTTIKTTVKPTTKAAPVTKPPMTLVFKTTKAIPRLETTSQLPKTTTRKVVTSTVKATTKVVSRPVVKPSSGKEKLKEDQEKKSLPKVQSGSGLGKPELQKSQSSGLKTSVVTITSLLLCVAAVWLVVYARSARGRAAVARLRGHTRHDPDVRYLHTDVDDD